MESIMEIMGRPDSKSPTSWQESTELTARNGKVSIYSDRKADINDVIEAQVMIKKSFPSLPASFYDVFDDRVRANNFTVQRLKDAVDYVIDNCPYPMPTIANFISYDKAVKYKTYEEMMDLSVPYEMNGGIWKAWLPVRLPNCSIVVWIHKSDIDRYQLYKYQVK